MSQSFLGRLMQSLGSFEYHPMEAAPPPRLAGLDPLTGAVRVLMWRCRQLVYFTSPDGLLLGVIRYVGRLVALFAVPLLGVAGVLLMVQVVLAQLGGILTSTIGVGLILLAVAVVVGRAVR